MLEHLTLVVKLGMISFHLNCAMTLARKGRTRKSDAKYNFAINLLAMQEEQIALYGNRVIEKLEEIEELIECYTSLPLKEGILSRFCGPVCKIGAVIVTVGYIIAYLRRRG